jgi:hypothetical protein
MAGGDHWRRRGRTARHRLVIVCRRGGRRAGGHRGRLRGRVEREARAQLGVVLHRGDRRGRQNERARDRRDAVCDDGVRLDRVALRDAPPHDCGVRGAVLAPENRAVNPARTQVVPRRLGAVGSCGDRWRGSRKHARRRGHGARQERQVLARSRHQPTGYVGKEGVAPVEPPLVSLACALKPGKDVLPDK